MYDRRIQLNLTVAIVTINQVAIVTINQVAIVTY